MYFILVKNILILCVIENLEKYLKDFQLEKYR